MKEGWQGSASCARNQSERDDYLDRAWYQFRGAVNLDSKNALYRVEFVALSEVLKRKPEYDAGIATQPSKSEIDQLLTEHQITESGKPTDLLQSLESLEEKALDAERNETLSATQRAVADAKEAIRLDPMDGFAWGKLGSAYFDLGDYKNAEDATQKAVEIFDERAKSAPAPILAELARDRRSKGLDVPPDLAEAESNDVSTDLSMLGVYLNQLADICHKLHKKREAARYREKALRVFDVQRMMQSSETTPHSLNAAQQPTVRVVPQGGSGGQTRPKPLPLNPAPPCPLPVHETCQMPAFNPQPYDPNNPQPYKAPDTRDYDRCVLGNQREDARYQQCLQQQPRQQQNH